jgi:hypothetical protein
MIVGKIWNLTNAVRVRLTPRSSQRQVTFPDNVCSYCPPVTVYLDFVLSPTQILVEIKVSLNTVNNIIVVTYWSKCHRLSLSLISVNSGIT